jgi:hypothetical protein
MSKQSEAGKGDAPRKQQDQNAYSVGWNRIFGKNKQPVQPTQQSQEKAK